MKLHRTRIDGIDSLKAYDAPDGTKCSGYHRHGWSAAHKEANLHCPLKGFDTGLNTVDDFITRICSEMQIKLSSKDVGFFDDDLFGS